MQDALYVLVSEGQYRYFASQEAAVRARIQQPNDEILKFDRIAEEYVLTQRWKQGKRNAEDDHHQRCVQAKH